MTVDPPARAASQAIPTPCIGVCTLDAQGLCDGCHRTSEEIAAWLRMSDAQRLHLMKVVLPQRERALRSQGGR